MHPFGCFLKWWYPQIIHFKRGFLCKPSILGYHHFRKLPLISSATNSHAECRLTTPLPTWKYFQGLLYEVYHGSMGRFSGNFPKHEWWFSMVNWWVNIPSSHGYYGIYTSQRMRWRWKHHFKPAMRVRVNKVFYCVFPRFPCKRLGFTSCFALQTMQCKKYQEQKKRSNRRYTICEIRPVYCRMFTSNQSRKVFFEGHERWCMVVVLVYFPW